MTNRPKQIGSAAEGAVVKAARTRGFPHAERVVLHGNADQGDIRLTPGLTAGVVLEVKGGEHARRASDQKVAKWLLETERERVNAGADIGLLVTARPGIGLPNAHRWHTHMWFSTFLQLVKATHAITPTNPAAPIHMTLDSALALLRAAGYGTPEGTTQP